MAGGYLEAAQTLKAMVEKAANRGLGLRLALTSEEWCVETVQAVEGITLTNRQRDSRVKKLYNDHDGQTDHDSSTRLGEEAMAQLERQSSPAKPHEDRLVRPRESVTKAVRVDDPAERHHALRFDEPRFVDRPIESSPSARCEGSTGAGVPEGAARRASPRKSGSIKKGPLTYRKEYCWMSPSSLLPAPSATQSLRAIGFRWSSWRSEFSPDSFAGYATRR